MDFDPNLLIAVRRLSDADRELVAATLADSLRLVEDDMGDSPEWRHAAYRALSKLVRAVR